MNQVTRKITEKPQQILPLSKKLGGSQEAEDWRHGNVDYYGDKNSVIGSQKIDFEGMYKLSAGYLDESQYSYITNPYNTNSVNKFPARLRNYDIISPIVYMLLGEKSKRRSDPVVVAINSDITTIKEQRLKELVNGELNQMYVNGVNGFVETGFISRDIKDFEALQTEVDSIKDDKAITGQNSLNYIVEESEFKRKSRKGFYDFMCTGYTFSYKDVLFDNIKYTTHSALHCGYTCSEETEFIEDGEAAWIRRYVTLSDIVDEFHEELTKEEIKQLENYREGSRYKTSPDSEQGVLLTNLMDSGKLQRVSYNSVKSNSDLYEIVTVNWKSKAKVGKVKGTDVFGEEYEFEVDEDFKPREGEEVDWRWVNQTWEGTRIADLFYKRIRPIPFQRGTFDNPSDTKLLINGRNIMGRHFFVKSPVKKLEPYQERYNAIHWHIEKVMNKNKDKLTILPKGLIPDDDGMGMHKMMYYADAHGFLFIDEVDKRKLAEIQAIQVLDLGLGDYLRYLYEALAFVRQEAEDTLGITRQRKGQTFASEGKGVTEQALVQSAVISEEIFLEHEEFEKREYQGLLDLSKFAWRNGKKATFIDSEKRTVMLDIIGDEYREMEYSVSVMNGNETHEKLERIRNNGQAILQNGGRPSVVAKMESVKSIEEMIDILEIDEDRMLQIQSQASQAEQELEGAKFDQEERFHNDDVEVKVYEIDSKIAMSQNTSVALDKNAENDLKTQDLDIKRDQLNIQREKILADVQMNRENNETALKNPVSGEKK